VMKEGRGRKAEGSAPAGSFRDATTVRVWVGGLREQWGEEPGDMAARIETLERFCGFVECEPDAIIAECSREVEGGKRIRIKKRRFYSERIDEFQHSVEGDDRAKTRAGNVIRSFMIHNGIFMQGGVAAQRYQPEPHRLARPRARRDWPPAELRREHAGAGAGWLGLRQLQRAIATAEAGG